jgi:pimeloyl-ACP methyl ester carboxylesterase
MASNRGKLPKLAGTLFKYGSKSIQVAFKTGNFKQQVIFIGGLTDGFLATDYVEPLAKALEAEKWSLVQPLLSSSYIGFGTTSLKEDAIDIEQLLNHLIDQENSEGFILVGHSTGCQDIVNYLRTGGHCTRAVRGAILQAPVSDREFRATLPEVQPMLELAEKMVKEGKGEELMPRDASPEAPMTAYRYRSLSVRMGDDDLFSSDFTDAELKARLGHMSRVPTQVMFSMSDEFVPEHVDKVKLIKRLCDAMGGAEKMAIPYGNHSLSNRVEEAVKAMITFVKKGGPKGWDDPWG